LLVHAAEMANRMTQWGASHVHAHFAWGAASYAIAAARLAGLPMSFTCHGSDVYARPVDLSVKCRSAQAVVAVAPMIARDVAKLSGRSKCQLIYCGVDERQWLPLADRTQAHGRWLFVGRLVDCKGVDDVIDAWSLLPEGSRPVLDIVGEGELQPVLMAQCAAANLQSSIRFLGAKPTSWLMQHAPAYRALIAPFKQGADGSRDTAPLVLKEAMAMGLPIVSTDFVDVAAVVGDRCALLCPVSLPEALATAVLRIEQAGDDVLCEMGKAGRVRVSEYFTLSQQAKQMSDLFERMAR
jgi:glycosyltransferase involved in cell wall biosynthesis